MEHAELELKDFLKAVYTDIEDRQLLDAALKCLDTTIDFDNDVKAYINANEEDN